MNLSKIGIFLTFLSHWQFLCACRIGQKRKYPIVSLQFAPLSILWARTGRERVLNSIILELQFRRNEITEKCDAQKLKTKMNTFVRTRSVNSAINVCFYMDNFMFLIQKKQKRKGLGGLSPEKKKLLKVGIAPPHVPSPTRATVFEKGFWRKGFSSLR